MPDNTLAIRRLAAFGRQLEAERKKRGLSQEDVMNRCHVSIHTISELETGQRTKPVTESALIRIVVGIEEDSDRIRYWLKIGGIPFDREKVKKAKAYVDAIERKEK